MLPSTRKRLCGVAVTLVLAASTGRAQSDERGPLDDARRGQLSDLLSELGRPPFGTGASLTVSLRGSVATIVTGTLRDGGPAVTEGTRFNVASVSKLLTAAKVIDLAHDRRLALDDPLERHLPGVRCVDGSGLDRTGDLTLRRLLQHRAGLPHQPGDLDPRARGSDWADPGLLRALAADWTIVLRGQPGEYAYSNVGYALLGATVERAEVATFATAMAGFLRDLGMEASTFWPDQGDLAHGRVDVGGATTFREPAWYRSRYALPFNGLWATTRDLARFGEALVAAANDAAHRLHAMTRLDARTGHGPGPVHRERLGARSLEHDGSGPGFFAWLVVIPDRELVLAVACNGGDESRERGQRFARVVAAMLDVAAE